MLSRLTITQLRKHLLQMPAVALLGPRQVGKTTLAKLIAKETPAIYLDLESPKDALKLQDPLHFLSANHDKLIILDEIQRAPDLFLVLRGLIDENRAKDLPNGQFLLLGSASMDLLRQSSESLAGRIRYIEMSGLNICETGCERKDIEKLWLRGGFPNSYLASDDDAAMDWLEDLIRTYLERDIPQMGFQISATRLRRLWTMLAHLQGEPINITTFANNLEIQRASVNHYIDILTDLLLIRRIEPWHINTKKRLVKTPRYYIRDSGIQHRLLSIDNHDMLLSTPTLGKSWEGFVMENIHSVLPRRAKSYFYRTSAGAEIDLVIRFSATEVWAIEIKYGTAPKLGKHFSKTCDDVGATHKYVVYGGEETFSISNDITMISLPQMMENLQTKN